MYIPGSEYAYDAKNLRPIEYKNLDLTKPWQTFDIRHDLTDKGMAQFSADWNTLIHA